MEGHYLMCKHRRLTVAEEKEFLKREGIERSQLPAIFLSDPALASIRPAIGDIIEITRPSIGEFGEHQYYRRVVSGW
jgi:DNA-directed RNA polymerase subunit H (RpoH/RPB5)